MLEVFISYSHADTTKAEIVKEELKRSEIRAVSDSDFIKTGDDWRLSIDQSIRKCHAVVALMTKNSAQSPYVTYEWAFSFGCEKPVLPLKYDDCDLHPRMEAIQYADFSKASSVDWHHISDELRKRVLIDGIQRCESGRKGRWMDFDEVRTRIDQSYTDDLMRRFASEDSRRFRISKYRVVYDCIEILVD